MAPLQRVVPVNMLCCRTESGQRCHHVLNYLLLETLSMSFFGDLGDECLRLWLNQRKLCQIYKIQGVVDKSQFINRTKSKSKDALTQDVQYVHNFERHGDVWIDTLK